MHFVEKSSNNRNNNNDLDFELSLLVLVEYRWKEVSYLIRIYSVDLMMIMKRLVLMVDDHSRIWMLNIDDDDDHRHHHQVFSIFSLVYFRIHEKDVENWNLFVYLSLNNQSVDREMLAVNVLMILINQWALQVFLR